MSDLLSSNGVPGVIKLEIEVGRDLRSVAAEVGATWKAAMAGEPVQASDRIVFVEWRALCAILTPDRYDLLRALAKQPASGVLHLARVLGRDTPAVEADMRALAAIGLVLQDDRGVFWTSADEIESTIRIAA